MQYIYEAALNKFLATATNGLTNKSKKRIKALYKNNWIFNITINRLINVYMSTYSIQAETPWGEKSDRLPAGMSERIIKFSFLTNACCVLTKGLRWNDTFYPGKYALYGFPSGKGWNINGDPLSATVMSMYNGMIAEQIPLYIEGIDDAPLLQYSFGQKEDEEPRGFIVWENEARTPLIYTIIYYASCIADAYRTLDVTRFWLKRPVIFTAEPELVDSINEVVEAMDANEQYTIEANSISGVGQATNVFNTNANGQALKDVTSLIEWFESKMREEYGIDSNAQMDKKGENVNSAEITVNDEYQHLRSQSRIDTMNLYFDKGAKWYGVHLKAIPKVGRQGSVTGSDQIQEGENNGGRISDLQ